VQVLAQATGRPLIAVPEHIVQRTADLTTRDRVGAEKLFAAVKRRLDRENPGYER
jgi:hypothetical protein